MVKLKNKLKNINKLVNLYKKFLLLKYINNLNIRYKSVFQLSTPDRQHYSIFRYQFNHLSTSTGFILAKSNILLKYYKRSSKSNTGHILFLQKTYNFFLKFLYLYYFKNFNYRNWLFFQKFTTLVEPSILYLFHKKSYNTYYRPVKRIKKKIKRILFKN